MSLIKFLGLTGNSDHIEANLQKISEHGVAPTLSERFRNEQSSDEADN